MDEDVVVKNITIENVSNSNGSPMISYVAEIDGVYYANLHDALSLAGAAGAGDTTIEILKDIDLTDVDWTPITVDGYHGADIVTVNGNGHTITNLSAPLFKGGFAGGSGIVISDLTIKDSKIESTNAIGSGAFIETIDSMAKITLDNCHLINSSVTGPDRVGGLIGWTSGYNKVNDGPVKTYITIKDCSVVGNTITGGGSVGGINGHAGANAWTYTTIEDCKVENNELISTDDGSWRVGLVVGTSNVGQVAINEITASGNTLTQGAVTANEGQTDLIGRYVPGAESKLVIDDVAYDNTCKPYAVSITDTNGTVGYASFDEAVKNIGAGDVTIELSADAILTASNTYALGTADTNSITINGNKNRFDIVTTYMSGLKTVNPSAKLILNDMTVSSTKKSGTWDTYDVIFECPVEINNVIFEKSVALENDATLNNVTINETHDYYALWVSARGQEINIDGLTINSDGRGIKIDEEYVKTENAGKVTFNISNADINTKNKAAIVVKNKFGAAITAKNVDISDVKADRENLVWIDEDSAADQKEVTVNGEAAYVENQRVVLGEDMYFSNLTEAAEYAKGNGTIKLISDVSEEVEITAPVTRAIPALTIDLAGYTLNGNIIVNAGAKVEIKDGKIVNENSGKNAIETLGEVILTNVDAISVRSVVRVDEYGVATINSGSYKVNNKYDMTIHAINASKNAEVTVNGGVFVADGGASEASAAVSSRDDAVVTINGGKFSNGVLSTLSGSVKDNIVVYGGFFDQDPTDYKAADVDVITTGNSDYPYVVSDKKASKINVALKIAKDDKDKDIEGLYNIILTSKDEEIYEFVSAEFTFEDHSTTVGGGNMQYEILGIEGKTVAQKAAAEDKKDQFIISIPNADDRTHRLTGKKLVIGQVQFIGQGTIDFGIIDGLVVATQFGTDLGRYYRVNDGTLVIGADAEIDGTVTEVKRDVVVNVAYNHPLVTGKWDDDKITVTIKDCFGNTEKYGVKDLTNGTATFNDVQLGRLTVTLEAPGFRKYVYETTLEEGDSALVLNFWNNVKRNEAYNGVTIDPEEEIETGKGFMAHNFLVGDIVMDYTVDEYDLAAVTSYYGTYGIENVSKYLKYDLNRDGNIDIIDVHYVLHTLNN